MKMIQTETIAAPAIRAAGMKIIPLTRTTLVHSNGSSAALRWTRPEAVIVQHADGSEEILVVSDETRKRQVGILLIGIIGSFLIWLANKPR